MSINCLGYLPRDTQLEDAIKHEMSDEEIRGNAVSLNNISQDTCKILIYACNIQQKLMWRCFDFRTVVVSFI